MPTSTLTTREPPTRADAITCLAFKKHVAGSLRGFADLHLPRHRLKLFGCSVHEANGKRWVALPAKPQLDQERQLITDERGKLRYSQIVCWDTDTIRSAFSDAAVAAVISYAPGAFDAAAEGQQ